MENRVMTPNICKETNGTSGGSSREGRKGGEKEKRGEWRRRKKPGVKRDMRKERASAQSEGIDGRKGGGKEGIMEAEEARKNKMR